MSPTKRADREGKWFPMTPAERGMALALQTGRVSYTPGSWDKKFARSLAEQATDPLPMITPKQREHLSRLIVKYRRQLSRALVESVKTGGTTQERLL